MGRGQPPARADDANALTARRVFAPRQGARLDTMRMNDPRLILRYPIIGAATTWVGMPLAETEFGGLTLARCQPDLTGYTEFRLLATVLTIGSTNAKLRLKYWTGAAWANAENTSTGGDVSIAGLSLTTGAWAPLLAAARADVPLTLNGLGGNGLASPIVFKAEAQFR